MMGHPLERLTAPVWRLLPARYHQVARYVVVGALGLVTDVSVLTGCLVILDTGPHLGRVVSYLVAATFTWSLHRTFTFPAGQDAEPKRQWASFMVTNALGGGLNYAIYAGLITWVTVFAMAPPAAVVVSSAVALAVNYTASRLLVFRATSS